MDVLINRGAIALACLACLLAGCDAEIGPGTYYCGPEGLCAPGLACNENTFICDRPGSFPEFSCPDGSQADEPNDQREAAASFDVGCGAAEQLVRCIADGSDTDFYRFEIDSCAGTNPHLEFGVRFPVAMVGLEFEVLDESGDVLATSAACTPEPNFSGMEWQCASLPEPAAGAYYIRVRSTGTGNCEGACDYNQYRLLYAFPVA